MDIIQTFYDKLATQYDKLFLDWKAAAEEQALILNKIFSQNGFNKNASVLDCACGIGTQALGLALEGYKVIASDISEKALEEAEKRAKENAADIRFLKADFCALDKAFKQRFDIIIAMDNALPHMMTRDALKAALKSITNQLNEGGMFVASIRDYDGLIKDKPKYSAPYIHKTDKGQRVCFQTWEWEEERYKLKQYIIEDEEEMKISKFECEYRATLREEITQLLIYFGMKKAEWKFPEETGFYQPIIIAKK